MKYLTKISKAIDRLDSCTPGSKNEIKYMRNLLLLLGERLYNDLCWEEHENEHDLYV